MDIKISHSFITVDDQDKALAFYRDALGLVVNADAPLGPFRWSTSKTRPPESRACPKSRRTRPSR